MLARITSSTCTIRAPTLPTYTSRRVSSVVNKISPERVSRSSKIAPATKTGVNKRTAVACTMKNVTANDSAKLVRFLPISVPVPPSEASPGNCAAHNAHMAARSNPLIAVRATARVPVRRPARSTSQPSRSFARRLRNVRRFGVNRRQPRCLTGKGGGSELRARRVGSLMGIGRAGIANGTKREDVYKRYHARRGSACFS